MATVRIGSTLLAIEIGHGKGKPRERLESAALIAGFGVAGSAKGGGDRQVSLIAAESLRKLEGLSGLCTARYAADLTTEGIALHLLPIGARLRVGCAVVEISQIGKRCFHCELFTQNGACALAEESLFARVIEGAVIHVGDAVESV